MKLRTHIKSKRSVLTTNGFVEYERYLLIPADENSKKTLVNLTGYKSVAPLDYFLEVEGLPFTVTVSVMLDMAYYGSTAHSYTEAAELARKAYGLEDDEESSRIINASTIREMTNYTGKMVYLEDCRKARRAKWEYENCQIPMPHNVNDILYFMIDGAALNTRHVVTDKDGNNSSWKENKLAVFFKESNVRRWTERNEKGELIHKHEILHCEYVTYTGSVDEFKWHVLAGALRNGYGKVKQVVIISDGATWIHNMKKELFPEAVHILDLFHLKENTHEFAKAMIKDDKEAEEWAWKMCDLLETGQSSKVLQELEKKRFKKIPANTVDLKTYILNHKDMINYPEYKNKGFFVGSGIVESANKSVLQKRLKGPGMRWNVPTARYVLALMAKKESGLWEKDVKGFVKNQIIVYKNIPARLPRSEKEVLDIEEKEIAEARKNELMTWKKKRVRSSKNQQKEHL